MGVMVAGMVHPRVLIGLGAEPIVSINKKENGVFYSALGVPEPLLNESLLSCEV